MKSFIIGCVAAIVVAVGAALILDPMNETASMAYKTVGVRL